jgi:hypothetical protein
MQNVQQQQQPTTRQGAREAAGNGNAQSPNRGSAPVVAIGELLRTGLAEQFPEAHPEGEGHEETASADAGGDGAPEGERKPAPKTLDEVAERLGLKVEELYELELKTGGEGRAFKLGELKDAAAAESDLDARTLIFEQDSVERENALLREREELNYVLSQLPQTSALQKLRERATAETKKRAAAQEARILETIPEWKDKAARDKDLDGMNEFVQEYGYGPADVDRIKDHRLLKLVRDSWKKSVSLKAALEKVKNGTKGAPPASGQRPARPGAPNSNATAPTKHQAQKQVRARIGSLLRTGR